MEKYYFVSYFWKWGDSEWKPVSGTTQKHPFQWFADLSKKLDKREECSLSSWREITQEEYQLHKDIIGNL